MAYTLQQLSDFEDIRTLKHRYFRGVDTADLELLRPLFTSDVKVRYRGGGYNIDFEGQDNLVEFIANSLHSRTVAMHHGHMPEITMTGEDTAEGIWYLEDIFINLESRTHLIGTALYRDQYRREDGVWKIAVTEYDRVLELSFPLRDDVEIKSHKLAKTGRRFEDLKDISHFITWDA